MAKKAPIDWVVVEREYRAGSMSIRALAEWAGCSEGAIRKRAKRDSWTKDLSQAAAKATKAKMLSADAPGATTDEEVVQSVAATRVLVVTAHRAAIKTAKDVVAMLIAELSAFTMTREELETAIEALTTDDDNSKRFDTIMRAVSLPSRSTAMKSLTASIKDLVILERQAFSLDEKEGDGDRARDHVPLEDRLNAYQQRAAIEAGKEEGTVAELPTKKTAQNAK